MADRNARTPDSFYLRNWRWFVLAMLFLATFPNYFDRQTLGAAMPPIADEFGFDEVDRENLLAAANGYTTILWLRRILGFWEAVNFLICITIIARLFPAKERSLASGIFGSGAFAATLIAPTTVIFLSTHYNWRLSFVAAGGFGLLWVVPWLLIFKHPERRALDWNRSPVNSGPLRQQNELANLKAIFCSPGFWGVYAHGNGARANPLFRRAVVAFLLRARTGAELRPRASSVGNEHRKNLP